VKTVFAITAALAVSATGSITQFPGKAGCVNSDGSSSCARGKAVGTLGVVTVSPDGKSVYAAGGPGSRGALGIFSRNPTTGAVTQLSGRAGCVLRAKSTGCTRGPGLETPSALAVSPDGTLVVTAALNGRSIGLYRRAAGGALTSVGTVKDIVSPSGLAFRTDGNLLLVASGKGLLAFRLSGTKLIRSAGPIPCDEFTACTAVAFSPDGLFAYAVAGGGAHGSITTYLVSPAGLVEPAAPTAAHALKEPRDVAVSPDGQNVYVAASVSSGVAVFTRDPTTGLMAQSGCVTVTGSQGDCGKTTGLAGATSLAISADGKNLYVASSVSNRIAVFDRGGDGMLRRTQALAPRGVKSATGIAVSPDGHNVYAAGHGLAALRRR
jgi:6-phosphogluconolactonase (cycloisomerase 2 family)